jgi:hypothetical protein
LNKPGIHPEGVYLNIHRTVTKNKKWLLVRTKHNNIFITPRKPIKSMYLPIQMLEPTTASIGLYLITHPPRIHKYTLRKPVFLKRVCKHIGKIRHSEAVLDAVWDELGNSIVDNVNVIPTCYTCVPSWAVLLLYACLIIVIIVT